MPDFNLIGEFLNRYGFPIFAAVYLLLREDRCLKFLEAARKEDRQMFSHVGYRRRRPRQRRKGQ